MCGDGAGCTSGWTAFCCTVDDGVDRLHTDRTWTTVERREPRRLDAVLSAAGLPRY